MSVVHSSDERLSVSLKRHVSTESDRSPQSHIEPMKELLPENLISSISLGVCQICEPPGYPPVRAVIGTDTQFNVGRGPEFKR